MSKIMVKTYKSQSAYKRAVRGEARRGWRVISTTSERETGLFKSFLGLPMIQLNRLLWPFGSTTTFVVTFEKEGAGDIRKRARLEEEGRQQAAGGR